VDRRALQAVVRELLGEAVRTVLGAGEDQRLRRRTAFQQVTQHGALLALDTRCTRCSTSSAGALRGATSIVSGLRSSPFASPRCLPRTSPRTACSGGSAQHGEHAADVADETHVEHAVGLVEDEVTHAAQVDVAFVRVIEQAAGVATTTSTPRRSRSICGRGLTPPKISADCWLRCMPRSAMDC